MPARFVGVYLSYVLSISELVCAGYKHPIRLQLLQCMKKELLLHINRNSRNLSRVLRSYLFFKFVYFIINVNYISNLVRLLNVV